MFRILCITPSACSMSTFAETCYHRWPVQSRSIASYMQDKFYVWYFVMPQVMAVCSLLSMQYTEMYRKISFWNILKDKVNYIFYVWNINTLVYISRILTIPIPPPPSTPPTTTWTSLLLLHWGWNEMTIIVQTVLWNSKEDGWWYTPIFFIRCYERKHNFEYLVSLCMDIFILRRRV